MASTKVRGITIELGADTSGITKALKGVNSEIGATQKQLKDVDRLLKLDPGNTDLLAQKQRLLKDAVGETKDKLETLKAAQEEVGKTLEETGKGQEQYDALTREIVSCEHELENLEKKANESNVALQKIAATGEKMKDMGGKISAAGEKMMPLTVGIAGVGAAVVKTTADFDAAMSKVAAVSGAAGDEFDALRAKAREMGETTKFTAADAAEAMNYMAMAGWKTEDMLSGINGIMSLAAASGEELGTTSDIVTDALTAFGLSAKDSAHFSDVLAAASSNANTNVAMMGESFKYCASEAGSLGYTSEDVSVALGLMANSGIKASQAGTSLRNVFKNMAKPTKESQMAMDRLGISLSDGQGNMYSLRQIMDKLRGSFGQINMPVDQFAEEVNQLDEALDNGEITEKSYNQAIEELTKQAYGAEGAEKARAAAMLGGARAMSGILAIANATEADYNKLTEAVDNSSQAFAKTEQGVMPLNEAMAQGLEVIEQYNGKAEAMAATMQDNAAGQFEILKSQAMELAISFGDILMPVIRDLITSLQGLMDKLNGMDEGTRETILKIAGIVAAIGPLLIIIGKVMSSVGTIMTVLPKLAGVISSLTGVLGGASTASGGFVAAIGAISAPVVAAVAAIGVLVAAFVHLWNTNEEFRNNIIATWDSIKQKFDEFGQGIVDRLNALGFDFKSFSDVVKAVWEGLCKFLGPVFEQAFKAVEAVLGGALKVLTGMFDFWVGLFTGDWEMMWRGVKETFSGIWEAITGIFKSKINIITHGINTVIKGINSASQGSLNIPLIPQLAKGGIVSSGTAMVGEAGPELLTVANGRAMVQPLTNNTTNHYAGATNNFYIQSSDPEQVAEEVSTILNNQMQRLQGAWA